MSDFVLIPRDGLVDVFEVDGELSARELDAQASLLGELGRRPHPEAVLKARQRAGGRATAAQRRQAQADLDAALLEGVGRLRAAGYGERDAQRMAAAGLDQTTRRVRDARKRRDAVRHVIAPASLGPTTTPTRT